MVNLYSRPTVLALSIALVSLSAHADDTATKTEVTLDTLNAVVKGGMQTTSTLKKPSDMIIRRDTLQQRSATLGNALAGELGIHSNPFGGGASKPIIRGQDGVRVKILQNGTDVVDMSALSPDHVVAADTLLANRVELVRGAGTLLYGTASQAGVVNVIDERIPSRMPQGNIKENVEGETLLRYNTGSNEKVVTASLNMGVGQNVAVRVEGLTRRADDYDVPGFQSDVMLDYLPDSHNKSTVGTVGVSYIGDKGHIGVSYSRRQDKYGIPGHNHAYDNCIAHVLTPEASISRYYLKAYPHLIQNMDFSSSAHFHCGTDHAHDPGQSHEHPLGYEHDHTHPGPWIDMESERIDVRTQWEKPFKGLDKIALSFTSSDYYHEENDHEVERLDKYTGRLQTINNKPGYFGNQGKNVRVEFHHTPVKDVSGLWGVQWQKQESFAHLPHEREEGQRYPLIANTNKQVSIFGLERWQANDKWAFEFGTRFEKQSIPIDYSEDKLDRYRPKPECWDWGFSSGCLPAPNYEEPDLTTYKEKATSYSIGTTWDFKPDYRLSATYSHNERLPTPMELYYHGKHLATHSFEFGNIGLDKEKSDNLDLGISFSGDKWSYAVNAYHSRFKNYIYNENVYREGNLFMRRHNQAKADFYGLEGMVTYNMDNHAISLFGDLVRGKLKDLPNAYAKAYYCDGAYTTTKPEDTEENMQRCNYNYFTDDFNYSYEPIIAQPNMPTPRLPPARLGLRWQGDLSANWSADAEYMHVFGQNRISKLESATASYDMLNLGLGYHNHWGNVDYTLSLRANNVLDEKVYIHNSFLPFVPQMGRNFSLSANFKF